MWNSNPDPKIGLSRRWGWWVLLVMTTLWLLWITLRPDRTSNGTNFIPFAEHSQALACLIDRDCSYQRRAFRFLFINVLGNVLVFIPLGTGFAGVLQKTNGWRTVLSAATGGFILSLSIELIQLTIPSRATDIDDLIFNTVGTILGALLFVLLLQPKGSSIKN